MATLNVAGLQEHTMETLRLALALRGVRVCALQEVGWQGYSALHLPDGWELVCSGPAAGRTHCRGVALMFDPMMAAAVTEMTPSPACPDRLLLARLRLGGEAVSVVAAYAPVNAPHNAEQRQQFWQALGSLLASLPAGTGCWCWVT